MLWGTAQDRGLQAYYQALIGLRRASQPLWRGERSTVVTDDARGVYGYRCASEGRSVVVVLNASAQAHGISLPTLHGYQVVLTTAAEAQWDGAELRLPPWGGVILRSTGR